MKFRHVNYDGRGRYTAFHDNPANAGLLFIEARRELQDYLDAHREILPIPEDITFTPWAKRHEAMYHYMRATHAFLENRLEESLERTKKAVQLDLESFRERDTDLTGLIGNVVTKYPNSRVVVIRGSLHSYTGMEGNLRQTGSHVESRIVGDQGDLLSVSMVHEAIMLQKLRNPEPFSQEDEALLARFVPSMQLFVVLDRNQQNLPADIAIRETHQKTRIILEIFKGVTDADLRQLARDLTGLHTAIEEIDDVIYLWLLAYDKIPEAYQHYFPELRSEGLSDFRNLLKEKQQAHAVPAKEEPAKATERGTSSPQTAATSPKAEDAQEDADSLDLTMPAEGSHHSQVELTPVLFDGRGLFQLGKSNKVALKAIDEKIGRLESDEEAVIAVKLNPTQEGELREYFGAKAVILNLNKLEGDAETYSYFMDIITGPDYRNALQGGGLRLTPDRFEDPRKHLDKA